MVCTARFINGDDAIWHIAKSQGCEHKREDFSGPAPLRVWAGMMLGVFHYDPEVVEPIVTGKYKVIEIGFGNQGGMVKIQNLLTYQIQSITNMPSTLHGSGVVLCMPPRTAFERSIQEMTDNTIVYGTSTTMLVLMRDWDTLPKDTIKEILEPWPVIRERFSDAGAFNNEVLRMQRRIHL